MTVHDGSCCVTVAPDREARHYARQSIRGTLARRRTFGDTLYWRREFGYWAESYTKHALAGYVDGVTAYGAMVTMRLANLERRAELTRMPKAAGL